MVQKTRGLVLGLEDGRIGKGVLYRHSLHVRGFEYGVTLAWCRCPRNTLFPGVRL